MKIIIAIILFLSLSGNANAFNFDGFDFWTFRQMWTAHIFLDSGGNNFITLDGERLLSR